MSIGQSLHPKQMAELAGVTVEQLEEWLEAYPEIPRVVPDPGPWPSTPRINVNWVLCFRALRDGRTIEEAKAEVLANGRAGDTFVHTPPKKTDQEKTRDRIDADRKRLKQELRRKP